MKNSAKDAERKLLEELARTRQLIEDVENNDDSTQDSVYSNIEVEKLKQDVSRLNKVIFSATVGEEKEKYETLLQAKDEKLKL